MEGGDGAVVSASWGDFLRDCHSRTLEDIAEGVSHDGADSQDERSVSDNDDDDTLRSTYLLPPEVDLGEEDEDADTGPPASPEEEQRGESSPAESHRPSREEVEAAAWLRPFSKEQSRRLPQVSTDAERRATFEIIAREQVAEKQPSNWSVDAEVYRRRPTTTPRRSSLQSIVHGGDPPPLDQSVAPTVPRDHRRMRDDEVREFTAGMLNVYFDEDEKEEAQDARPEPPERSTNLLRHTERDRNTAWAHTRANKVKHYLVATLSDKTHGFLNDDMINWASDRADYAAHSLIIWGTEAKLQTRHMPTATVALWASLLGQEAYARHTKMAWDEWTVETALHQHRVSYDGLEAAHTASVQAAVESCTHDIYKDPIKEGQKTGKQKHVPEKRKIDAHTFGKIPEVLKKAKLLHDLIKVKDESGPGMPIGLRPQIRKLCKPTVRRERSQPLKPGTKSASKAMCAVKHRRFGKK